VVDEVFGSAGVVHLSHVDAVAVSLRAVDGLDSCCGAGSRSCGGGELGLLFGDGGGALVIESVPDEGQLLAWDLGLDAEARHILQADHGGYIKMDGREVFKRAVRVMVDSAKRTLEQAKVRPDEVKLLVPHQANIRIIQAACDRLGIDREKAALVMHRTGNTSSASIPLALVDAIEQGRLEDGDLVLLAGFGAGMTWGSALIRWQA
jgi:3-oxoacyl-[acyl-carrier-protein] synthase-3